MIENVSLELAEVLCRKITADLPEYFGLAEVNEHYFVGVRSCQNLAVQIKGEYVGLISIDFPYPNNSNIYWMGVLRSWQSQGIGGKLLEAAAVMSKQKGASSMTVETLAPSEEEANYLKTYKFYEANGFAPLINLKPQGYEWNMVYMLKLL